MKIGIDFGTSFSVSAVVHHTKLELLLPGSYSYGMPSIFYYDELQGILIGNEAEDAGQGIDSKNMIREIKMDLFEKFTVDKHVFSAKEIVGHILAKVAETAVSVARNKSILTKTGNIEGAVISVPAAFKHNEKAIIEEAAQWEKSAGGAGLKVLRLIKEPVAAAIAYFKKASLPDNTNILIYDLGGGTCDIAVVRSESGICEKYEVTVAEMIRTGGRKWDDALFELVINDLEWQTQRKDLRTNECYSESIKRAVNDGTPHCLKHKLSIREQAQATATVSIDGKNYKITITKKAFEEKTRKLLKETIELAKKVYSDPKAGKITYVICVGGSSNMPQIEEALIEAFPNVEVKLFEPENAVAYGTAIYADSIDTTKVVDIAPFSYGIEYIYNYGKPNEYHGVRNLIKKGDKLPKKGINESSTAKPGQKSSLFEIFESDKVDNYRRKSEKKIGEFTLHHPDVKGDEHIKTEDIIMLNESGLLEAQATDKKSGKVEKIRIKLKY